MKALEGQTGIVLRMEPGEYHFYPQLPLKKLHISNHDACDGLAVGLSLKGIRDFTLDGGGSRSKIILVLLVPFWYVSYNNT